jgi:hypothetical protein
METTNRGAVVVGVLLISTGAVFLLVNLLPGLDLSRMWPGIFYAIAVALLLPPVILPSHRRALAAFVIPGVILLVLGLILTYQVITGDWESWAYAWALIPASVGAGLWVAARLAYWGAGAATVGLWLLGGSLVGFVSFSAFLGSDSPLARGAPAALIALGGLITATALIRRPRDR